MIAALLFAALLTGCAGVPSGPRERMDPRTGTSFTMVETPLIFARERRDVAANARDYLTVVAVESNEAGRRQWLLVVHQWSTIDRRSRETSAASLKLLLVADGRDFAFTPLRPELPAPIDGKLLLRPEDADVVTTLYPTDVATLEYIAESASLTAAYPESFALPFALWRDERDALMQLLRRETMVDRRLTSHARSLPGSHRR